LSTYNLLKNVVEVERGFILAWCVCCSAKFQSASGRRCPPLADADDLKRR